ncbi:MAG: rhodanese-like domain-containing protein [Bacteroidales bacterium]
MKRKYIIPILILLLLGAGILILPGRSGEREISPEELLQSLSNDSRFWSTDAVADKIIKQDPSMLLIDVREPEQFNEFSLPGAVNIPLKNILDEEWEPYFDAPDYDVVLFSNGQILPARAWVLLERLGYTNLRVMEGGLNKWAETILQPPKPDASAPGTEWEQYDFRRAARQYFTGGSGEINTEQPDETIQVPRRKKKNVVEGGC